MFKKLICTMALLSGNYLAAMEQAKTFSLEKESLQNKELVKILLTHSLSSEPIHEVAIPLRLAKLLGSIAEYLRENPDLIETGFPLSNVTLVQWRLIESQLERLHSIAHADPDASHSRKTIIEEYEKLDANGLIKLIHALDYLDIPPLLVIARNIVLQSTFGRFTFEQINSLPGLMRNHVILQHLVTSAGPMPAKKLAVYKCHELAVASMCVTNDGKVVSGSWDMTVRVWDMQGKEHAVCSGHKHAVTSVGVTNDGTIVSGSHDKTIRVCDMNGKERAVCRGHDGEVYSVCVTNDGKIVSGSRDARVRVRDMQGKKLAVCTGHMQAVTSVCVTNDGKIVSGSIDKTVRVWDMTGKKLAVCRVYESSITSVCVSNDGKVVSGSMNGMMCVWDADDNQVALFRGHDREVTSVCVTLDGKIVSGSVDKTARVWDMTGKELAVCRVNESSITSVCVTNDGKIVSGSMNGTMCVWDVGLLDCIVRMDVLKSRALWALLQRIAQQAVIDKEDLWKEIMEIVEDDPQGACAMGASKNEQ